MNPDYYGGFSTDLNYKGFALNAVFSYSIGGKRPSSTYESYMNSGGMSAAHTDLLDRWTPTIPIQMFQELIMEVEDIL